MYPQTLHLSLLQLNTISLFHLLLLLRLTTSDDIGTSKGARVMCTTVAERYSAFPYHHATLEYWGYATVTANTDDG
jgi:hypothetical protein